MRVWEWIRARIARVELVTASAALLTALATIGLAISTQNSVTVAQQTFTELERPYVYAMPISNTLGAYFKGNDDKAQVTVRIKNIGRGPARITKLIISANLVHAETEKPGSQIGLQVMQFALGQGDASDSSVDIAANIPRTPGTIDNIQQNIALVYISTFVSYLDAAGNSHETGETWRFYLEPDELRRVRLDRHT